MIFTITDPVGALDAGNITGTSDALRWASPGPADADTIGIVYTTSEANSVYSSAS